MAATPFSRQRGVASKVKTSWVQEANTSLTTCIESEDAEYVNGLAAESRMFDDEFSELCAAVDKEFGLVGSSKTMPSSEAPASETPVDATAEETLGPHSRSFSHARNSNVLNVSASSPAKASVSKAPAKTSRAQERALGLQVSQESNFPAGVHPASAHLSDSEPKGNKESECVGVQSPLTKCTKSSETVALSEGTSNARVESTACGRPPLSKRSSRTCTPVDSNPESNARSGSIPPASETKKSKSRYAADRNILEEIAKLRATSVRSMRVVDLRAALKMLGLPSSGLKAALQAKLQEAVNVRIADLESMLSKNPGGEKVVEEPQSSPSEADTENLAPSAKRSVNSSEALKEETGVGSQEQISAARHSTGLSSPEEAQKASEIHMQGQEVEREKMEEENPSLPLDPMPSTETSTVSEVVMAGDVENDIPEAATDETRGKDESDCCAIILKEESQPKPYSDTDETDASQPLADPEASYDSNNAVRGEPREGDSSKPLPEPVSSPGCIIPVGDNVAEVIPALKHDNSPCKTKEEGMKETETWTDDGIGEGAVQLSGSSSPKVSVEKGAISSGESVANSAGIGSGTGFLGVAGAVTGVGGHAGCEDGGDGEGAKLAPDEGDGEESRHESIEDAASSTPIAVNTTAKAEVGSSDSRPKSGEVIDSSPSLSTSVCSSYTASVTKSDTAGSGGSVECIRVGEKRPMSTQQPRNGKSNASSVSFANVSGVAMSTNGKNAGDGSGSSGDRSSKKRKVCKVSLQEQMSRLKKDYEDKKSKVGTPGGALKNAGAAADVSGKTAASHLSSTVVGTAKGPSPAPPAGVNCKGEAPAGLPVETAASGANKPSAPLDGVTAGESKVETTVKSAATASKKPSNLVSTMHSFLPTLVKNENLSGAGVKKWDRLAAGASASVPTVPALRKAQEAKLIEEKRARERADARSKLQAAVQSTASASESGAGGRVYQRDTASGAGAKVAGAKPTTIAKVAVQAENFSDSGDSSDSSVDEKSSHLAPLRVTGMLAKLVPDGSNRGGPLRQESLMQASSNKVEPGPGALGAPAPSVDVFTLGAGRKFATFVAESEAASVASTRSSISSSISGMSAGLEKTSVASTSAQIEMRIREQRARIEAKRIARKEQLFEEDEKKKADLENKKLREAARLEAAKRAKHEAEMKAREQKALRQAEVERRREQERAEREAREAKEREEKEAKRKAWLETKEAMEKAQKAAAAALAAAKKPRIPNPLHSGNASGVRGSTTAAISKPLVSMEKNMLLTASAPAAAVMKPSSAGIGKTQAGVPSSAGGSALVVGNGGGARSTTAAETINSYEMSDHDGSSSSSDSENEEAHKRKKKKQIPAWAKGSVLSDALKKQYSLEGQVDPDAIFDQVFSCDLEAIFPVNKKKYYRRGSTANWTPDRVTPQEIITYKRSVGILKPNIP